MELIIRIFDILASVLTIVSLNLVTKSYKYWLMYVTASVFFITVCIYNKIPGLTIMGVCLLVTGIRNYLLGKRNESK